MTIKRVVELKAKLPNGSVVIPQLSNNWVTWYEKKDSVIKISTCPLSQFECQNDTDSIVLSTDEFKYIVKALKLKP